MQRPQFNNIKEKKKPRYSDLTFLPPRPNKYLDVLTYSEWSPNFEIRDDQISEETLELTNADRQEFVLTVAQVNKILKPLRGKVAAYDRFILLYLIIGLLVTAGVSTLWAIFLHYAPAIIFSIIYFVVLGIFIYVTKKKSSMLIRHAHLWLSLYLHAENNRYYMNKNIVLRPGFMAKWIEILYLAPLMKTEHPLPRVLKRNNVQFRAT